MYYGLKGQQRIALSGAAQDAVCYLYAFFKQQPSSLPYSDQYHVAVGEAVHSLAYSEVEGYYLVLIQVLYNLRK